MEYNFYFNLELFLINKKIVRNYFLELVIMEDINIKVNLIHSFKANNDLLISAPSILFRKLELYYTRSLDRLK